MSALMQKPEFIFLIIAVFGVVFILTAIAVTMAKFYRRCGADEALVRTGAGGNRVVIGGGITVYPILHQVMPVSLRSIKLSVERSARNALVTRDKIKANVTTELYIKVEPLADDVMAAARSFGKRNLDEHAISDLIEGKLTDALRSVAANQTFMDLHGKRKEFAEHIQSALSEELKKNGLTLENVSITALAMVPVKDLDPQDVFDAEGLRAITESVQSNNEKTNRIQREKEIGVKMQNVEARRQALALEQTQAQAEADQQRRVAEYAATQQAETAKAVYLQQQSQEQGAYEKKRTVEMARIAQEQAIAVAQAARQRAEREAQIAAEKAQMAAEIDKQREVEAATVEKQKVIQAAEIERQKVIEAAEIEKQKVIEAATVVKEQAIETARIGKQIAITQSQEQAARAEALRAQAEAEQEQAKQGIVTVEETAKANREKVIAIIKAEEEAQQSRIAAEREAYRLKLEAETRAKAAAQEAAAMTTLAEASLRRGEAEARARQLQIEAENAVSTTFVMRDVALKALEVLPSVTRELMAPARAIGEIKVLQVQGAGIGAGGEAGQGGQAGAFGAYSPVLKSILEAGAAFPLLKEMLRFAQVEPGKLAAHAGAALARLPEEVWQAIERSDPALADRLAELRRQGDGIGKAAEGGRTIEVEAD